MMSSKDKLLVPYPVVVEGKYDKIRLSNIIDAQIIVTDGFGIFKKEEKRLLLRRLASASPLIVLTDSDGGGKIIRSHLSGMLPKDKIIPLYIPQIKGKEKRKEKASKSGFLGVEGMKREVIEKLFAPFAKNGGVSQKGNNLSDKMLTKLDFFDDGLSGGADAVSKRDKLAEYFNLPSGMSAKALLEALNIIAGYDEYKKALSELFA